MLTARLQRVGVVCGVVIGAVVLLALMLMPRQISRGQGLPPTPAANELGWRTHTTAAAQWRYDPASWVPLSDAVLSTSTANAQLTLTFLGSGVSLHYATSSDGGSFSAQIDDLLPETLDTRSAGGAAGDAVWSKAVDSGVHTLIVTHHSGTLRLKSVAVQGDLLDAQPVSPTQAVATRPPQVITSQPPVVIASPVPSGSGWTTYQDTDPRLVYGDGTWQTFPVARANGGTLTGTADAGASLVAYFEGSSIRVVYASGPEGRAFAARIDDALRQTGDAYGRAYSYGHTLTIEGLEYGRHTLTITDNDGAIWIEAIQVLGELLTPLPDESDLSLIFSETFDAGVSPAWRISPSTAEHILTTFGDSQAVRLEGPGLSLRSHVLDTADFLLKAEIYVPRGSGFVMVGANTSGSYYLTIETSGTIYLYQDTALLATAATSPFALDTWKTLEVFLWQGILRVEVDNQPLIEITIEQPVSPRIAFDTPAGTSTFWVDQVELWGPPIPETTPVPTTLMPNSSLMTVTEVVEVNPPDIGLYLYGKKEGDFVLWDIEQDAETTFLTGPSIIYYPAATISPTGTQIAALYWHWDFDLWQPESPHIVFFDASTAQAQFAIRINGPFLLESYNIKWSPVLPDGSSWLLVEGEYSDDPNSWYGPWGFLLLNYQDILAQVDASPGGCSIDVPCLVTATAIAQGANEELYSGSWSPDGQAIAYDVDALGDTTRASSTPIDSLSTRTPIAFPPGDHWWGIQWSPMDSNLFVAVDSSTDNKTIYTFTRDGTIRNQVTYPAVGESDSWPFWSPDGTRIGFSRSSTTNTGGPYLTHKDATNQTIPVSRPGNLHDWWGQAIRVNFEIVEVFGDYSGAEGSIFPSGTNPIPYHDMVRLKITIENHGMEAITHGTLGLAVRKLNPTDEEKALGWPTGPIPDNTSLLLIHEGGGRFHKDLINQDYALRWGTDSTGYLTIPAQSTIILTETLDIAVPRSGINRARFRFIYNGEESDPITPPSGAIYYGIADAVEGELTRIDFNHLYIENPTFRFQAPNIQRTPGLKAAMFWAFLHETQDGTWLTYNPNLACYEPGWAFPPEEATTQITRVVHGPGSDDFCKDYRYLEVQTMINGYLNNERDPTRGVDQVFNYMLGNFGGTYSWSSEQQPNLLFESKYVAACHPTARQLGFDEADLAGWDDVETLDSKVSYQFLLNRWNQPGVFFDILTIAPKWLEYFTDCQVYHAGQSQTARSQFFFDAYTEFMGITDTAISAFFQQCSILPRDEVKCDPTSSALSLLAAQKPVLDINGKPIPDPARPGRYIMESIVTQVDGGSNATTAQKSTAYNAHFDAVRAFYIPEYDAVIQPVLGAYHQGEAGTWTILNYQWNTVSYVEPADPYCNPR